MRRGLTCGQMDNTLEFTMDYIHGPSDSGSSASLVDPRNRSAE